MFIVSEDISHHCLICTRDHNSFSAACPVLAGHLSQVSQLPAGCHPTCSASCLPHTVQLVLLRELNFHFMCPTPSGNVQPFLGEVSLGPDWGVTTREDGPVLSTLEHLRIAASQPLWETDSTGSWDDSWSTWESPGSNFSDWKVFSL